MPLKDSYLGLTSLVCLPVRAYIRAGDKGEFISRPRIIAIRELAPTNVLYYEGNKYQVNKTLIPLNRYLISDFLSQLNHSQVNLEQDLRSREEHYQRLLEQTDPNSEFERVVLKAIYEQGIKLPDSTQELISEANCKPDFIYKKAKIAIFCDGSVHDSPEHQQRDRIKRDDLLPVTGYMSVSISYKKDLLPQLKYLCSLI